MSKSKISFRKLPRVLTGWEKRLIVILCVVAVVAAGFWLYRNHINTTIEVPKFGGSYIEGVLGEPKFINPIIAQDNTVDMDLVTMIYSPLFHYNMQNELVNDLAENYNISEDGLTVTVTLREGVTWHDGEPFSADDVVYTVQSIQNPNLQSPLKSSFDNVTVEKGDDRTVIFKLEEPYAPFISGLTFGILPKHLWEQVEPANFPLTELNLQPVGTGSYKFFEFKKDKLGEIKSYTVEANKDYYLGAPNVENITLKFYPTRADLAEALYLGDIEGLPYDSETAEAVVSTEDLNEYDFRLPRYNAVFLNYENNEDLEYKKVREALDVSIDLNALKDYLPPGGELIAGPILENYLGYSPDLTRPEYNFDKAHDLLHEAGWNQIDDEGFRTKDGERIKLTLLVSDFPEHQAIADFIVESWKKIGIEADWESLSPADIQARIRDRSYDAILFGQVTGHDSDPYPFWHSSQRQDPGLNLTSAEDEEIDTWLEEARKSLDETDRADKYKAFQAKLLAEHIAIFLYSPSYHYAVSDKVQGIEAGVITNPSERFTDVNKWYIKTQRVPKD